MTFYIKHFDPAAKYTDFNKFSCNHPVIDKFVKSSLKKQVSQGLSVAYAVFEESKNNVDPDRFVGFYTLANHSVSLMSLGALELGSLPRTIPCVRLIMLGVNQADKGKGLGKGLMNHAFDVTKKLAQTSGCFGMYLDADPEALGVYLKLGFRLLDGDQSPKPSPMFLLVSSM